MFAILIWFLRVPWAGSFCILKNNSLRLLGLPYACLALFVCPKCYAESFRCVQNLDRTSFLVVSQKPKPLLQSCLALLDLPLRAKSPGDAANGRFSLDWLNGFA